MKPLFYPFISLRTSLFSSSVVLPSGLRARPIDWASRHLSFRATFSTQCLALLVLQCLDLHSTLMATPAQRESNRLIQAVAQLLPAPLAILAVKVGTLAIVTSLFVAWRRSCGLDRPFALCLTSLGLVYAFVVTSNYLGR